MPEGDNTKRFFTCVHSTLFKLIKIPILTRIRNVTRDLVITSLREALHELQDDGTVRRVAL